MIWMMLMVFVILKAILVDREHLTSFFRSCVFHVGAWVPFASRKKPQLAGLTRSGPSLSFSPRPVAFIQRPYFPLGTLRAQMLYPKSEHDFYVMDTALQHILDDLHIGYLTQRYGGLDARRDWQDELSLGEQQVCSSLSRNPVPSAPSPLSNLKLETSFLFEGFGRRNHVFAEGIDISLLYGTLCVFSAFAGVACS